MDFLLTVRDNCFGLLVDCRRKDNQVRVPRCDLQTTTVMKPNDTPPQTDWEAPLVLVELGLGVI